MWLFLILCVMIFAAAITLRVVKKWNGAIVFLAAVVCVGLFFTIGVLNMKAAYKLPAKVDEVPIYFMKDVKTDQDPFVIGIHDISSNSFYFYAKDGNLFKKMDLRVEDLKVIDKDAPPTLTVVSKTDPIGWFSLGLNGSVSHQIQLPASLLK
jgi:hypothetical protein